jgi:peptidoglycan-associated lipoprotein
MKIKTLLITGLGTLLVVMTGCKSPERFTVLPGSGGLTAGLGKSATDLSTPPVIGTSGPTEGIPSPAEIGLAEDGDLANREMNRGEFASQTVYFDYDQANVKTGEIPKAEEVAALLRVKGAGYDLLIEGHCDERGTEEYNRALGERRALAIREVLMQTGLSGTRVFTRTFGKDKPALASHDEAAFSRNRRGEFVLVLPKKLTTTQLTK